MKFNRRSVARAGAALACVAVFASTAAVANAAPKPAPVRPPAAPNCGATVLKADNTPWQCTFDDEFNGTSLDTKQWVAQTSFVTGDGNLYACYVNTPQTVSVNNGALNLSVIKVSRPVWCPSGIAPSNYAAGSVTTYHLFSQKYGRFEARIMAQASSTPGLNEDFWLYPDDRYGPINEPDTGEIDVSQQFSSDPDNTYPYLHYAPGGVENASVEGDNIEKCQAPRGVWNTYDLEWTPSSITISVNGTPCLVNTSGSTTFSTPEQLVLTQALGDAGAQASADTVNVPATMHVDYVRAWK